MAKVSHAPQARCCSQPQCRTMIPTSTLLHLPIFLPGSARVLPVGGREHVVAVSPPHPFFLNFCWGIDHASRRHLPCVLLPPPPFPHALLKSRKRAYDILRAGRRNGAEGASAPSERCSCVAADPSQTGSWRTIVMVVAPRQLHDTAWPASPLMEH